MKTVFTNSDLVHVFNQQNQERGRNNSDTLYFENNLIYSYGSHYLLGEIINNNDAIIINNKGYSNTTARHIYMLIPATRDKKQFFTESINSGSVLYELNYCFNKLPRARQNANYYLNEIQNLFNSYFEFKSYYKKNKLDNLDSWQKIKSYYFNISEDRKIKKLYKIFNTDIESYKEKILSDQKARKAKEKKKLTEGLKKWRKFKTDYIPRSGNDFLRVNLSKNYVETSQRVKVTITEARRVIDLIEKRQIIGKKIDNKYLVTAINGFLKVGCHNISIEEINNIKKQIK